MSAEWAIRLLEPVATNGVPGPEGVTALDVGNRDFLEFLGGEVLDALVCRGGATCRFFEGPYGSGKTHLLRLIADGAQGRGMAVVEVELSAALGLEDWHGITKHVLQRISIRTPQGSARSLPNVLDALAQQGAESMELQAAKVPHPGFGAAMAHYIASEATAKGRSTLRQFLMGERVRVPDLRRSGWTGVRNPLSRRNAEQVLNTVVTGLHLLGVPGTVLSFDENEKTFQTTRSKVPKRITVAANLMRRLIDACPTGRVRGVLAVFAVLPGFLPTCSQVYPALGQRLQLNDRDLGWRSPVLPLSAVTGTPRPNDFVEGAVDRLTHIVSNAGVSVNGLDNELWAAGMEVIALNAGEGFKRPLMKRLAALTIRHLQN